MKSRVFERNFFYVLFGLAMVPVMLKRWLSMCWVLLIGFAFAAEQTPWSKREMLQGTLESLQNDTRSDQIARLSAEMTRTLNASLRLHDDELERLSAAADCIHYLQLTESVSLKHETEQWLIADPERLHLLTKTVLPSDNLKRCFQCLEKLIEHDPANKKKYFKLMLAMSVVWDQPKRPPLHHQRGKEVLPFKVALEDRYDYFKELYASGDAKLSYDELTVRDLCFVVDTPVPLSELQWARANEEGSALEWLDKFSDIVYDRSRLGTSQFQWPYGEYTLAAIRQNGGICVDQGYYAAITARAFGIPAVCLEATGKSASHEWFGYIRAPGEWVLDVGRYEEDEYTTGWTTNPQTNEEMTDHDIAYENSRAQNPDRMVQSDAYIAIAETLVVDPENVRKCAEQSRKIDPQNRKAWQIEMDALIAEANYRELLRFFDELKKAFEEHPDVAVDASEKIGTALKEAGMQDEADRLLRQTARQVDDDRDDLVRFLGMDEIEALAEAGNIKKARRQMEDLMEEHIEDGKKTVPMIRWYLELTKDTDQTKAAAKFLDEYIEELFDSFYMIAGYRKGVLELLLRAYEQDEDEKGIAEVKARIADI